MIINILHWSSGEVIIDSLVLEYHVIRSLQL